LVRQIHISLRENVEIEVSDRRSRGQFEPAMTAAESDLRGGKLEIHRNDNTDNAENVDNTDDNNNNNNNNNTARVYMTANF
jgi:hypothetical protein